MQSYFDISVAMTTYNGEMYLEEQLESILNQTADLYEIVICDDASSDGTISILRRYEREYPNLIDIHINDENLGVTRNFSYCLGQCTGDVIAISDQDDVWKPGKIAKQLDVFKRTSASIIFHNATMVTESLDPIDDFWAQNEYMPGIARNSKDALRELVHGNFVQGASMMIDSDFLSRALPIPEICQYDHYLAVVASTMGGLYDIEEQLSLYRQHEDQNIGVDRDVTRFDKIKSSWELNRYNWHKNHASRWQAIWRRLREIANSAPNPPTERFIQMVKNKYRYERNEAIIHDSNTSFSKRASLIADHWKNGWYSLYGPQGRMTVLKDIVGMVLSGCTG